MPRYLAMLILAGALPLVLPAPPAAALTAKQKMETCKFGATSQKLTGAKRNAFIKKCMAKGDAAPASGPHRLTRKEKMETCKVGASAQNLTGAKRNAFLKKCMAKGNYEPPARRAVKEDAMKKRK